jgi:hypothetical protein
MITEGNYQHLHDQATRGVALSAEQTAQLEEWYAHQDREESATLTRMAPPQTVAALRTQVDAAVVQLSAVGQRTRP